MPRLIEVYHSVRERIHRPTYKKGYDGEFPTHWALDDLGLSDPNHPIYDPDRYCSSARVGADFVHLPAFLIEVKNWWFLAKNKVYMQLLEKTD